MWKSQKGAYSQQEKPQKGVLHGGYKISKKVKRKKQLRDS